MNRSKALDIANFRYSLIAPIVSRLELNPGETQMLLLEAAKKTYQIPFSTKTQISLRTIERYLNLYRNGGYEALIPKYLSEKRGSYRIPREYMEKAAALKRENMKRPILQIIDTLEMSGEVPKGILKRSTVYDYFVKLGISKEQGKKESKAFQRFTPKHRNQRWQGDTCHLLHLPNPDDPSKSRKVYLIAWLDEYSRMITHAQCYFREKDYTLEDSLKKAMIKFGVPEVIYVDNGSVYSSKQLKSVCGHLSIQLSHTRPYRPQGRGKLERMFQTIQSSFLPEIEVMLRDHFLTLEELNEYLFIWIRQHYHEKIHSATKQKPIVAFESDETLLRIVDPMELENVFLLEETRTVDKTCCFKLRNLEFAVEAELVNSRILVRFNPYDLSRTQVYYNGRRFKDASLLEIPEHIDFASSKPQEEPTPTKTGLNYLRYLKEKDVERLAYAEFIKGGER